jgi:phosphoserine phosphatase
MVKLAWQLQTPISGIVFDCDGTLSTIEGINELAKNNGVAEQVEFLTETAMGKTGLNANLYQRRLNLVYPHKKQIEALGHQYYMHCVPDASAIIEILHRLNKSVYIVSAGLYPAVKIFGDLLHVPSEHIYAVNIQFDEFGNYRHYDETSPLINHDGKRVIVSQLKALHANIIHIGDGLNDYVTHDLVTRFIGYGGVYYRKNIAQLCQYYIHTLSLAPFLPLVLTHDEYKKLTPTEKIIYHKGFASIQDGRIKFNADWV